MNLRYILAKILAVITRQDRYFPDIEWSNGKLFTHDLFRVFEYFFGAECRIKPSITTTYSETGRVTQMAHTFEASIALLEVSVRNLFKLKRFRIYVPVLQIAGSYPIIASPYIFAIAFDTVATSSLNSFTYTCTGSDRALVGDILQGGSPNDITVTYNGVSMTKSRYVTIPTSGDSFGLFTLVNPASGGNTVSIGGTGVTGTVKTFVSYTGVSAFANATSNTNSGASISLTITIGTANSWAFSVATGRTGPHNLTPSTGVTNDRTTGNTQLGSGDSGPLASGTTSHTWLNGASLDNAVAGIEIVAVAGATVNSGFLNFF